MSSGASVASTAKVKKTGAAKVVSHAVDADPELAAVANTMHATPAGAMPRDTAQEPSTEVKMQEAAKSGGMKGLAGLFSGKKASNAPDEASNGVHVDTKGKAVAGPTTPAKAKA